MIKLKPIVNEILLNEDEQITWGQVAQMFDGLKKAQNKETGKEAVKSLGKIGLSLLGVEAINQALTLVGNAQDYVGAAKAMLKLGKDYSSSQLKNPKASEFKKLTGPFWKKVKLSDEISTMLDDNVESMFINQVLLPKLQNPGSANEPIPNMDELLGKWLNDKGLTANADIQFKGKSGDLSEATMNAEEMARHKKKLEKLKKYLAKQGDQMMAYPADLPNTVFNAKLMNEDLRDWFGTGGKGGVGGGGWDRYNSSGDRIGKCGDAKEGEAYSACLSKEKAEKLGKEGRAAFVKRKRAAQKKGGDAKKGGERKKGQKPIKVKTGVKEEMTPEQSEKIGMPFKGKHSRDLKENFKDGKNPGRKGLSKRFGISQNMSIGQLEKIAKSSSGEKQKMAQWNLNMKRGRMKNEDKRIPRKPGQPANSKKHSDLYTDENPKGTIHGLKFATVSDAEASINKIKNSGRSHAHKIQAAVAMEQRAKAAGKDSAAAVYRRFINSQKKDENLDPNTYMDKGKAAPYGSGYQKLEELERKLTLFLEKNIPTDKSKWSYYKSQAKKKFDVYPSAYANAWAAKMYKKAGGGWRKSK